MILLSFLDYNSVVVNRTGNFRSKYFNVPETWFHSVHWSITASPSLFCQAFLKSANCPSFPFLGNPAYILYWFLVTFCILQLPLKKVTSPRLSQQPPSKNWGPVKLPRFELVGGSTPPPPIPQEKEGGGVHTMDLQHWKWILKLESLIQL